MTIKRVFISDTEYSSLYICKAEGYIEKRIDFRKKCCFDSGKEISSEGLILVLEDSVGLNGMPREELSATEYFHFSLDSVPEMIQLLKRLSEGKKVNNDKELEYMSKEQFDNSLLNSRCIACGQDDDPEVVVRLNEAWIHQECCFDLAENLAEALSYTWVSKHRL